MGALFSASGFGVGSSLAVVIMLMQRFLCRPTRWIDRRRLKNIQPGI